MKAKSKSSRDLLKLHLENGYRLIDRIDAYHTPKVARSWENGFTEKSFGQMVKQSIFENEINDWTKQLIELFNKLNLDYLRFKSKTSGTLDDSQLPAGKFKRAVEELDKIANSDEVFCGYVVTSYKQPISYVGNVIAQGTEKHTFTNPQVIKLMTLLWNNRGVIDSNGNVLIPFKPLEKHIVCSDMKISESRFETIARTIKAGMKVDGISLDLKYPISVGVYLIAIQDSK